MARRRRKKNPRTARRRRDDSRAGVRVHELDDIEIDVAPRRALRALTDLRAALDRLEVALVVQARASLVTWSAIGRDLGLSETAAYRRHVTHDPIAASRRAKQAEWERQMGGPLPY
jgi:hypothetical protein